MNVPTRFTPPLEYKPPSFIYFLPFIVDKLRVGLDWCVNKNQSSRGAMVADADCGGLNHRQGVALYLDGYQDTLPITVANGGYMVVGGFEQTTNDGYELQFMLEGFSDSFKTPPRPSPEGREDELDLGAFGPQTPDQGRSPWTPTIECGTCGPQTPDQGEAPFIPIGVRPA